MKKSETDRIKNALVNVSTLAHTSDYYNPDRDISDIELIESIVMKEIPNKPSPYSTCIKGIRKDTLESRVLIKYEGYLCDVCGHELTDDKRKEHSNYCPFCGQKLDWSEL